MIISENTVTAKQPTEVNHQKLTAAKTMSKKKSSMKIRHVLKLGKFSLESHIKNKIDCIVLQLPLNESKSTSIDRTLKNLARSSNMTQRVQKLDLDCRNCNSITDVQLSYLSKYLKKLKNLRQECKA